MRRLARVRARLDGGHASVDDEYRKLLEDAYNAVQRLKIASHRGCPTRVGNAPRPIDGERQE